MSQEKRKPGRPKETTGTGKYGEQPKAIRVPLRLVEQVNELLRKEVKK